jgi:transposase-like protein
MSIRVANPARINKRLILANPAYFYVRYGVSYRDLEEIMEERGVNVDHATLNRWVIPGMRQEPHN